MFMVCRVFFFFFKQKTAYEMRISDWSSDVCSSDLAVKHVHHFAVEQAEVADIAGDRLGGDAVVDAVEGSGAPALQPAVAPAAAADGVHHFGAAHPGRDHLAHDLGRVLQVDVDPNDDRDCNVSHAPGQGGVLAACARQSVHTPPKGQ